MSVKRIQTVVSSAILFTPILSERENNVMRNGLIISITEFVEVNCFSDIFLPT